jgi:hypothetical protein
MSQLCLPDHQGGFYVYQSYEEALDAELPRSSHLFIAKRTILQVLAWGDCVKYSRGKLAFSDLLPLAVIDCPVGYTCNRVERLTKNAQFNGVRSVISNHTVGQRYSKSIGVLNRQKEREVIKSHTAKVNFWQSSFNTRKIQKEVDKIEFTLSIAKNLAKKSDIKDVQD